MFHRRLLLSLVVALSLCTLAAADSARVNSTLPHFATGMDSRISVKGVSSTPVSADAFSNRPTTGANLYGMNQPSSNATRISSSGELHNNIKYRTAGWNGGGNHGMAAPEPAGLMLLSTGLIGIAGLVRRKLHRG